MFAFSLLSFSHILYSIKENDATDLFVLGDIFQCHSGHVFHFLHFQTIQFQKISC